MAGFTSADEVYKYIGGMFETAVTTDSIVAATKDTDLVLQMTLTEPDAVILVDFPGAKVSCGPAAEGAESTVQLTMSGENANKFWQGKLNLPLAMAQRKVKMDGNKTTALKLLPLTGPLYETYRSTLVADGRDDLVIP